MKVYDFRKLSSIPIQKLMLVAVAAVSVIRIVGTKDDCFWTLDNLLHGIIPLKIDVFSHPIERGANLLSAEISDPYNSILLLKF